MKHNNPSGVAYGRTGKEAFERAFFCDRIAAFGGCVVFTVPFDVEMAEAMSPYYFEVLCAPDFEEEGLRLLKKWKNLRIFKIGEISRLRDYRYLRTVDFESLMDGGLIVQESQPFRIRGREDLKLAEAEYKGRRYMIQREPTEAEMADMLFGWYVEAGVSSNSVLFVKDGATLAIGTGEQDRVGVVDMTIFKAKRKFMDVEVFRRHGVSFYEFKREVESGKRDRKELEEIEAMAEGKKGGLEGSVLVSDGFFPFRDGVDVAAREAGISAIIQPGGSERDYEVIEACNEYGISMVFTGQRLFKH
jgi:phosphoribosylaminoimidazolecarboxamide formyltransferase/IMP cyclohydrolase